MKNILNWSKENYGNLIVNNPDFLRVVSVWMNVDGEDFLKTTLRVNWESKTGCLFCSLNTLDGNPISGLSEISFLVSDSSKNLDWTLRSFNKVYSELCFLKKKLEFELRVFFASYCENNKKQSIDFKLNLFGEDEVNDSFGFRELHLLGDLPLILSQDNFQTHFQLNFPILFLDLKMFPEISFRHFEKILTEKKISLI